MGDGELNEGEWPAPAAEVCAQDEATVGRYRLHRVPPRTRAVKVLYGGDELLAVQRAAAGAGLRPSSYVAAAALASATGGAAPTGAGRDRELLSELLLTRLAVRQYGVNLNQIAAALNSGVREAPVKRRCGWVGRSTVPRGAGSYR